MFRVLEYDFPDELHPAAWWIIDTHVNWAFYAAKAGQFDFLFAAQRDGADRIRHELKSPAFCAGDGSRLLNTLPARCRIPS